MIEGIICLIMAVIFFIYSLFAFKQKGPLLTSMYYISNAEDRAKMKTKKEYHLVAKTYLLLSIALLLVALGEIFKIQWTFTTAIIVIIFTVIYTFVVSAKNTINK